jgi:hypothetical protein
LFRLLCILSLSWLAWSSLLLDTAQGFCTLLRYLIIGRQHSTIAILDSTSVEAFHSLSRSTRLTSIWYARQTTCLRTIGPDLFVQQLGLRTTDRIQALSGGSNCLLDATFAGVYILFCRHWESTLTTTKVYKLHGPAADVHHGATTST